MKSYQYNYKKIDIINENFTHKRASLFRLMNVINKYLIFI